MSVGRSPRRRLGGLGAIFFLGTLGGIAYYVQGQALPDERDVVRKAATVVDEAPAEEKPVALPWEDRLDLTAAVLAPLTAPGATAAPASADPAVPTTPPPVDPDHALYVQDLNDGHRILLTLDPVLQDSALTIFRKREVPYAGAVMVDLRDNAVLVLAGHSTLDPGVDPLEIVTTAWAPAASTFKLVTTASLLGTGAATPSTRACFSGGLHGISDSDLADNPSRDTRCETLSSAVAHSFNLVIGKLAHKHLSQQQLSDTARSLLFETEIPFEFAIERSPAHIPNDAIERAKVAAGFWNVDLSPMHGALMASIFARGGNYQPPHIIDQVISPDGEDLTPARPKPRRNISRDVADALGEMMVATTRSGTARKSFNDPTGSPYIQGVKVAGKTGSLTGKREPYLNYNWFIGYAPAERPEVAFAVLLANEPAWRIKAHYAARRLVQIYLERRGAITRARDAELTKDRVVLVERDPSGAIVRATPTGEASKKPSVPAAEESPPLPPPPGATPKPPAPADAPAADAPAAEPAPPKPAEATAPEKPAADPTPPAAAPVPSADPSAVKPG